MNSPRRRTRVDVVCSACGTETPVVDPRHPARGCACRDEVPLHVLVLDEGPESGPDSKQILRTWGPVLRRLDRASGRFHRTTRGDAWRPHQKVAWVWIEDVDRRDLLTCLVQSADGGTFGP